MANVKKPPVLKRKGPKVTQITDVSKLNSELLKLSTVDEKKAVLSLALGTIKATNNFGGKKELRQNKFAMFHKGIPVDEITFVNAVLNLLKNNKVPAEEGLFLQEFSTLPKSMQNAWEWFGFKETSWSSGAIAKINQQLKDSNNDYNTKIEDARAANGLITIRGTHNITDYVSFFKETILANTANLPKFALQKIFVIYLEEMGAIIKGTTPSF